MAYDYAYSLATDGSKDFTTYAALDTQMVTDWGTDSFDADVVVTVYDTGDFTGEWLVTDTLVPTMRYPLIIKNAAGHSPTINATGNQYGVYFKPSGGGQFRFIGIEIYGATKANLLSNGVFAYVENVNSHDCTATNDQLFYFSAGTAVHLYNCQCSGNGYVYCYSARVLAQKCSFAGGDPGNYLFYVYKGPTHAHLIFEACSFDGSSLNAGTPIMNLEAVGDTSDDFPSLEFRNCIVFDGGWLLSQEVAGLEAPIRILAINNIFVDQDTGVFNVAGGPRKPDEGSIYVFEANCWFNCGNYVVDVNGTYANLSQLRAAGYDTLLKSINADPDETSPFDGTIQSTSPCIEAGIGSGVLTGVNGNDFNAYNPSIGADAQYDLPGESFSRPHEPTVSVARAGANATVTITTVRATDVVFVRYKDIEATVFSVEDDALSRVGSGDVALTGLLNPAKEYDIYAYVKR